MLRWMFTFSKSDAIVESQIDDMLSFNGYVYSKPFPCINPMDGQFLLIIQQLK